MIIMMWITIVFIVVGFVSGIFVGRTTKQSIEDIAIGCKMVENNRGILEQVVFFLDEEAYKRDMRENNEHYIHKGE